MRRITHRAVPSRTAFLAGSLAIGLLAAAVPATAMAATPATAPSILVFVRGSCVEGRAYQGGGTIKVVQKRQGNQIATSSISNPSGAWTTCVKTILAGDKLEVTETVAPSNDRTITVPSLTVTLDAATDVASGHAPDPGSLVNFGVRQVVAGLRGFDGLMGANTNGNGDFSGDWTSFLDVRAGDVARLFWTAPIGDTFIMTAATPSVGVEVGKATILGTGPYGSVTTTIRTASGSIRGTAAGTVAGPDSELRATFRKRGSPIKVKVGDRVRSSRIAGSYKVRASDLVVRKAGNGSLTATCAPGSDYAMFVNGVWTGGGSAGPGGAISNTNVSRGNGALFKGSQIKLGCRLPSGFGQVFTVTVK